MKKMMVILMVISSIFISCKTMTIAEFKQKYDWNEVVITNTDRLYASRGWSTVYNFTYLDKSYSIGEQFPCSRKGSQYYMLVDKKAPDDHYLVLWDKPVKQGTIKVQVKGLLTDVGIYNENFTYIEYKYHVTDAEGKEAWYNGCEATPIAYYDKLKKLKESQGEIVVDCHILEMGKDSLTATIRPFINLKALDNG